MTSGSNEINPTELSSSLPDSTGSGMTLSRISVASLLHRLQHGLSSPPVELVSTPHDRWPIPRTCFAPLSNRPLRILVLDSSFNPPTLAHLALANSPRPRYSQHWHSVACTTAECDAADYDAKLLLLSVRNPDKTLKAGDASYLQRLEMMQLLAKNITRQAANLLPSNIGANSKEMDDNVAVAIVDEPMFVDKSTSLRAFLRNRLSIFASMTLPVPIHDAQLTFLVGFDTLERFFSPRYYSSETQMISMIRKFLSPAPEGDDSYIVCARRAPLNTSAGTDTNSSESEELLLAEEFISSERILFIDIGEDEKTYSSTAVRNDIARLGLDRTDKRVWRKFVPENIQEYILNEKLYVSGSN